MALFFLNNCTYPDCKRKFSTLPDLIYHIEEEHLDFSPSVIEEKERQKVQYISLSYILKYSQLTHHGIGFNKDPPVKKVLTPSQIESEYILPEHDTVLVESEISDDSWNDECNNDFVNYSRRGLDCDYTKKEEYVSRIKKFACPVPGCNKRYKNINGIKYHTKNSHEIKRSPMKPKKMHKCHCGKSYKTIQGLKAHSISHKEVSFHKLNVASNSHSVATQRISHISHPYVQQSDILNNNFIRKSDVVEEEVLPYPYLEQVPRGNDVAEYDHNNSGHFGFFTPPYSYGNTIGNEGFSDNLMLDEAVNQNYQFALTYKKC